MNRINFIRLLGLSSGFLLKLNSFATAPTLSKVVWSQHRLSFRPLESGYYNLNGAVRTLSELPLLVYRNLEVGQELMSTFNEHGYAVRQEMIQGAGKGYLEEWIVEEGTHFLERKSYHSPSQSEPQQHLVFRYDPSGTLTEMSNYAYNELKSMTHFKHDSNGWLIRQDEVNPQGENVYWRTLEYDKEGHITHEAEEWKSGRFNHSDTHEYNEKGLLSRSSIREKENTRIIEYEYNDRGLMSIQSRDGDPELYSYEYDSQGNWVERKSHRKENLSSVLQRKIIYF